MAPFIGSSPARMRMSALVFSFSAAAFAPPGTPPSGPAVSAEGLIRMAWWLFFLTMFISMLLYETAGFSMSCDWLEPGQRTLSLPK